MAQTQKTTAPVAYHARALQSLHRDFSPNPGQRLIGNAIFRDGAKRIFARYGRNGGKSYAAVYCACRFALLKPKSNCYYIGPQYKQTKEIVWSPSLHERFIEPEFIASIDKQDTRINLVNGSFIKLDGSDAFETHRGWSLDLVVADEIAEFDGRWLDVVIPNLAKRDGIILFIGTPPRYPKNTDGSDHFYVKLDNEYQRRSKADGSKIRWMHLPSSINAANLPAGWLEEEKQRLIEEGEYATWQREYEAKIVYGGKGQIIPQFDPEVHVKPDEEVLRLIERDKGKLRYFCCFDPGSASCFAVLLAALNPYTSEWFFLDSVYETDQMRTDTDSIWGVTKEKLVAIWPYLDDWRFIYDEAATWFHLELLRRHRISSSPTLKGEMRARFKEHKPGISIIKAIFRKNKAVISEEKCPSLVNEINNYALNANGQYPDTGDHQIDNFRYMIHAANYFLLDKPAPVNPVSDPVKEGRMYTTGPKKPVDYYPSLEQAASFEQKEFDSPTWNQ